MKRPRIYVDFNEMLDNDLVLLSKEDSKEDSSGTLIHLTEGLRIHVYMDDEEDDGRPNNLIADGCAERHSGIGWGSIARWCCRIDARGIRHESDDEKEL